MRQYDIFRLLYKLLHKNKFINLTSFVWNPMVMRLHHSLVKKNIDSWFKERNDGKNTWEMQ